MPQKRLPENEGLPTRWALKNGAYYYRVPKGQECNWNGKKMFRLGRTFEEAQAVFANCQKRGMAPVTVDEARNFRFTAGLWEKLGYRKDCGIPLSLLQAMYSTARNGAPRRGLSFSLHPKEVVELANKSEGRCALTGIEWNMTAKRNNVRPWMPSLDRIDSSRGYEPGNVRLVCFAVNVLNQFGDAVLIKIASALVAKRGTTQGL